MRECKFRGRAICDYEQFGIIGIKKNTWVYGYYYKDVEEIDDEQSFEYVSYIRMPYGDHYVDIEIIPETVGEYIGLKDKNDVEIFENDIMKFSDKLHGHITFKEGKFIVIYIEKNLPKKIQDCDIYLSCYEVIGNIYENPKLLKEDE